VILNRTREGAAMVTGTESMDNAGVSSEGVPVRPGGRRPMTIFMWAFVAFALCLAVALAIAAAKPAIAVAAGFGLAIPIAVAVFVRRRRSGAQPAGAPDHRRRRLVWLLVVPVSIAVVSLVGGLFLILGRGSHTGAPPMNTASASYHAVGRVEGDGSIVIDERVVLDGPTMSGTPSGPATGAGDASPGPTAVVSGWQEAGLVDGHPSFQRTRNLSLDRTSYLAGTASIPLTLGRLTVTGDRSTSVAELVPQAGSRVEIVLPKGAVGATVPAFASRTDVPSAARQEVIVFAVDPYVTDVSFDVLRGPLRNSAGHALYNASLWGFWQWAAGAAATVVGGFVVNKLTEALWSLLSRRARSMFGRTGTARQAA
jgi:hypothetical protein